MKNTKYVYQFCNRNYVVHMSPVSRYDVTWKELV